MQFEPPAAIPARPERSLSAPPAGLPDDEQFAPAPPDPTPRQKKLTARLADLVEQHALVTKKRGQVMSQREESLDTLQTFRRRLRRNEGRLDRVRARIPNTPEARDQRAQLIEKLEDRSLRLRRQRRGAAETVQDRTEHRDQLDAHLSVLNRRMNSLTRVLERFDKPVEPNRHAASETLSLGELLATRTLQASAVDDAADVAEQTEKIDPPRIVRRMESSAGVAPRALPQQSRAIVPRSGKLGGGDGGADPSET